MSLFKLEQQVFSNKATKKFSFVCVCVQLAVKDTTRQLGQKATFLYLFSLFQYCHALQTSQGEKFVIISSRLTTRREERAGNESDTNLEENLRRSLAINQLCWGGRNSSVSNSCVF